MGKHEKLLHRLRSKPRDFTWNEVQRLLAGFGYEEEAGSGSRRKFINRRSGVVIAMHQPHPGNELKSYQVSELLSHLKEEGYL